MADLVDIPLRDEKDGSAQLVLLRSYLKDSESVTYTDELLITLLVDEDPIRIWLELVGGDSGVLPYSYSSSYLKEPINRVRLLTSDTNELAIKHTDKEILEYLEVIPLRYVVSCINLEDSTDITNPLDTNHPLSILRLYLKIEVGEELLDMDLVELLFKSGMNPFGIVIDRMERATSASMAGTAANTGNSLASIDGISFSNPTDDSMLIQQSLDSVALHASRSVYYRDPVFGMYEDGENLSHINWEAKWYAI